MKIAPLSAFREISVSIIARLRQRLAQRVGFESTLVGADVVNRAVRSRMAALGVTSASEYQELVTNCNQEWSELVAALLVSETWFFREKEAFKSLAELVMNGCVGANVDAPLRLLSIPCASGEEPFSMVMALLDAGFPQNRLQVDAVDLNGPALAQAQTGVYGNRSFRTADLSFRDRHFQPVRGGFLLHEQLRKSVRFQHGNLLQSDFLAGSGTYHFIFCRNLLIYLHDAARRQAFAKLKCLLAPDGLLFVGLAEQLLARDYGLIPNGDGLTPPLTWCNKGESASSKTHSAGASRPVGALGPVMPSRAGRVAVGDTPVGQSLLSARRDEPSSHRWGDVLEEARRLADAGKFGEAISMCQARLQDGNGCAATYYLLGLLREASGEPGAAECYRKALYLEPNHYEALLHMAWLAHNRGDLAAARLFRARAERNPVIAWQP